MQALPRNFPWSPSGKIASFKEKFLLPFRILGAIGLFCSAEELVTHTVAITYTAPCVITMVVVIL
jgi:hypothetical protein